MDLEISWFLQVISSHILLSTQMRLKAMIKVIVLPGVVMMNTIAKLWPSDDA